jgi:oxygen-independent coproporphyrinogen-3 oxidase
VRVPHEVRFAALPPLALYVHLPWCVRKCPYCDFNSHEKKDALPEREYVAALVADLESLLPSVWGRRVVSVFIGGGTPSLFAPESIDQLLAAVRARVPLEPGAEVTLEANPGTAEAGRFRGYREAGVNRLSLGIQSFDDAKLAALGRIHSAAEARRAIEMAQVEFDNVNLDIMYGLPQQTLDQALADARAALAFGTTHFSAYQLTLEPNTVFYSKPPPLPAHDLCADMQLAVEDAAAEAGFEHYETSALSRVTQMPPAMSNHTSITDCSTPTQQPRPPTNTPPTSQRDTCGPPATNWKSTKGPNLLLALIGNVCER